MPKPILNFVWFGPPKLSQGGQDVVGPVTIDWNFKHFPQDADEGVNPMVFWCQEDYQSAYESYFTKKDITIKVCSIEAYLKSCLSEPAFASIILKHYDVLVGPQGRNKTLDRVYMKDMFFNFLLATQGGYVLDTNVRAMSEQKANFPAYSRFMFPMLLGRSENLIPEVWLQYSPPEALSRAKLSLVRYFERLREASVLFEQDLDHSKRHMYLGRVAVAAVSLSREMLFSSEVDCKETSHDSGNWMCGHVTSGCVSVPELFVYKEYYNTHSLSYAHRYPSPFMHIYSARLEALRFDLEHGIDPNLTARPLNSVENFGYDSDNQTLLDFALRHGNRDKNREFQKECIQLLIEKGANLLLSTTLVYDESEFKVFEETPFMVSIRMSVRTKSTYLMRLLLQLARLPISILIHQLTSFGIEADKFCSPLLFATELDSVEAVDLLLENGALPDQAWDGQQSTPLIEAVWNSNSLMIEL